MVADNDSDDQTASETKRPRSRGNRPDRMQGGGLAATGAQPRQMPWDRPMGGGFGQPPAAPNGNTGVVGPMQGGGGHPGFQWSGGGGFQPGGIMGGQGQGGQGGMPNWQALAQQFMQRFQGNPMLQRLGMAGHGMTPPGAPPQGQPGGTPPILAGPQAAQGMQPGAAPQGGLQGRIGQLAALFGRRQQPGGIVGPGQGPQEY